MKKFSLVIPTYNERENVVTILRRLQTLLDGAMPGEYELIVVDDDSPDRTWEAAEALTAEIPAVRVIRRVDDRGLATAVVAGWKTAQGEFLGVIDADLQHPPEVVLKFVEALENGADLVVGSRHVEGGGTKDWSLIRRILSRGARALGCLILPAAGAVSDPMSGFFALRRDAVDFAELRPLGYKILLEVLGRGRFSKIEEVGYVFQARTEGASKVTWRLYWEYLVQIWRLRTAPRKK